MRHSYPIFFLLFISLLISGGCRKKPPKPVPEDTILGGQSQYTDRPDWINPSEVYSSGGTDLEFRDSGGILASGEQVEGLLPSVYFGFDQSLIGPSERPKMNQAAQYLTENPDHHLLIEGHCDWRGTTEYNVGLGDRRAQSAKQYLETLGISSSRLTTVSKGDLEAVVEGSEQQLSQDRRADLIIVR